MSRLYTSFISIGIAIQIKAKIFILFKSYITFAAQLRNFVVGLDSNQSEDHFTMSEPI